MTEEQWGVLLPWNEEPTLFSAERGARSYLSSLEGKELVRRDGVRVRAEGLRLFRRWITDWEEVDLGSP